MLEKPPFSKLGTLRLRSHSGCNVLFRTLILPESAAMHFCCTFCTLQPT